MMSEVDHEKCLRFRISRHPVSSRSLSNLFVHVVSEALQELITAIQEFNALSGSLTVMSKGAFIINSPS